MANKLDMGGFAAVGSPILMPIRRPVDGQIVIADSCALNGQRWGAVPLYLRRDEITATVGSNQFTFAVAPITVPSDTLHIYKNGELVPASAYTRLTSTTAVLSAAASGGDVYATEYWTGTARPAATTMGIAGSVAWNPIDKAATVSLSSGNTIASFSSADNGIRGLLGHSTGKYYYRLSSNGNFAAAGIANAAASLTARPGLSDADAWAHQNNGYALHNGYSGYGVAWSTSGDQIMVAVDLTAGSMWFGKNGVWMASSNPATNTAPAFTGITPATYYPIGSGDIGGTLTFIYDTPPAGFTYW